MDNIIHDKPTTTAKDQKLRVQGLQKIGLFSYPAHLFEAAQAPLQEERHLLPEGPGRLHAQEAGECHQEGWSHHHIIHYGI